MCGCYVVLERKTSERKGRLGEGLDKTKLGTGALSVRFRPQQFIGSNSSLLVDLHQRLKRSKTVD